jgi:hypothetical protein
MDSYSIGLLTGIGIIFLGAAIQTFHLMPTFFDKVFDLAASKITVAFLLIVLSFLGVSAFLQHMNREGFQNENKAISKWKEMSETYYISEVCSIENSIKQKLMPIYKQQDNLTDQQAEERFEKIVSDGTSNGAVSCGLVKPVMEAKDIDSFFTAVQLLPNTFLIQLQETAFNLNILVQKQYDEVMESLDNKEGFMDPSVGICSPEITEERRKFLREKKLDEAAQRCLLPEEVPLEKKDDIALGKVKKIQDTYDAYIRMSPGKPIIGDLVLKTQDLLKKLDELKKKAESGEIVQELQLPE